MIGLRSILKVVDNSGIKYIKCIKILMNCLKKKSQMGDIIVTAVYEKKKEKYINKTMKKLIKKTINKALIVTTKQSFLRKDGSIVKFDETSVVIFNDAIRNLDVFDKRKKINYRVLVPVIKELKTKKLRQIVYSARKIY